MHVFQISIVCCFNNVFRNGVETMHDGRFSLCSLDILSDIHEISAPGSHAYTPTTTRQQQQSFQLQ